MKSMNRCHIIFTLLIFVLTGRAQSGLRKPGIYEVDDTLIEVYNWKEPLAIREFKTINGTDIILFREFNGLTKKLKQEGMFKGGYSSGMWKFYGWTGRLKKEIKYDNMVKTFYSKKTELSLVDFDFEKYKSDSLFVYNYRKQKKENSPGTTPQSTLSKNPEPVKGTADTSRYKANVVLAETPLKNESGQKKKSKETEIKKNLPKNAADSLGNKKPIIAAKETGKGKKNNETGSIVKTADAKKEEAQKKSGDAEQAKQKPEVATESSKPKKENEAKETKMADATKPETQRKPVTEPVRKSTIVAEETAKPVREATAPELKTTQSKKTPANNSVDPEQSKQKPVAVKDVSTSVKENNADAKSKAIEPQSETVKNKTTPQQVSQKPPVEEIVKVKQEEQRSTKIKLDDEKKPTGKVTVSSPKNQQNVKEIKDTTKGKKNNDGVVAAKAPALKETDSTNYKANALLVEEYARSKNVNVPTAPVKPVNADKPVSNVSTADAVKTKSKEVKENTPASSPAKQNAVASKENKAAANTKSTDTAPVLKKAESLKPDSLKQKMDTVQTGEKNIPEKKSAGVNAKTADSKK